MPQDSRVKKGKGKKYYNIVHIGLLGLEGLMIGAY